MIVSLVWPSEISHPHLTEITCSTDHAKIRPPRLGLHFYCTLRIIFSEQLILLIRIMSTGLGDIFPNLECETTVGKLKLHDYWGEGYA